jgi:Uri superfamily endonuclease
MARLVQAAALRESVPGLKGSYLLLLCLDTDIAALRVGRLGQFTLAAGYYLYVGSAFGPGGLPGRLAYHRRPRKTHPHWHVDYLREHATLNEAWAIGCDRPLECELVRALGATGEFTTPVPGFGSSDSPCASHLLFAARRPSARTLTAAVLGAAEAASDDVRQLTIEIHTYDEER